MKTIYICEDNEQQLQNIKKIVEDFIVFHKEILPPQITTYTTPQDLLNTVQHADSMGLYLLDVDLQSNINGIELAEKIRQFDPRGFIIFITTYDRYMPLTFQYRVEALDYISKNNADFREQILQALERAFARYADFHKTEAPIIPIKLNIKVGSTTHYINGYDIVCAKVIKEQRRIKLYTSNGTVEYFGTLNDLRKELPSEQFYQCHRSTIINIAFLSSINTKESVARMRNGITVPISSRKLEELKKYFSSILE